MKMNMLADNPFTNSYDSSQDANSHSLWEILVARDSEAFVATDWSLCSSDFADHLFEGISAHNSLDPMNWTLRYPTLESYRNDWLEMSRRFLKLPLASASHRELLYRMQSFAKVEISDGRAVVWKQFRADEPLTNGDRYRINAQSIYRLHWIEDRWKIVGFVGYLPLESNTI